jgi:hypothetical protein
MGVGYWHEAKYEQFKNWPSACIGVRFDEDDYFRDLDNFLPDNHGESIFFFYTREIIPLDVAWRE